MTLVLDLELCDIPIQERVNFGAKVKMDVAGAIQGREDRVLVHALRPGSIIVHLRLLPGVCGPNENLENVAKLLKGVPDSAS